MSSKATTPIKAKRVPVRKSVLPELLGFGADNLFPQNLLSVVSDSVTAGACLSAKAEFIEGDGFLDEDLSQMRVHHSGLTLDTLLNRVAWNVSFFEAITLLIAYNGNGQIAGVRSVPAEFIRLGIPNHQGIITHGAVCPFLDTTYAIEKRFHCQKLPLFNPDPAVVLAEMEMAGGIEHYYGQLLYEPFWSPGDGPYHIPSWFPAIRAIESEGQLAEYDWRTISSGFNISGVYKVLQPTSGPDGKAYDPQSDPYSIENQIADFQGAVNAASVLVQRFDTVAEMAAAQFIDTTGANLSDRYTSTTSRAETQISRGMRVPNELIGVRRVGGIAPTGQEIQVSFELMQQNMSRYQRKISDVLTHLFKYWQTPILDRSFEIKKRGFSPPMTTPAMNNPQPVPTSDAKLP